MLFWRPSWLNIFICLSVFSTALAAKAETGSQVLFLGAGAYVPFAGRLTNPNLTDGSTSLTTGALPDLALTGQFKLIKGFGISPLIAYTVFGHKSNDGGETSHYLPIALRINKRFKFIDLRFGPGVLFYSINGHGGTASLSNGGGSTVYALPSAFVNSRFYYWDIGFGFGAKRVRLDFDGLVSGTFSKKRAVSLLANLSFGFF